MKGIKQEKLNWPLPRPLTISRHRCGQDSVDPLTEVFKSLLQFATLTTNSQTEMTPHSFLVFSLILTIRQYSPMTVRNSLLSYPLSISGIFHKKIFEKVKVKFTICANSFAIRTSYFLT